MKIASESHSRAWRWTNFKTEEYSSKENARIKTLCKLFWSLKWNLRSWLEEKIISNSAFKMNNLFVNVICKVEKTRLGENPCYGAKWFLLIQEIRLSITKLAKNIRQFEWNVNYNWSKCTAMHYYYLTIRMM